MSEIIHAHNLSKQYKMGEVTVDALIGVDFVVQKGEFVVIMGPSGSGKSTLLHLLGGLDRAGDGEISLAGRRLTRLNDDEVTIIRRRQVGFIFQFYNLLPTLSVAENIALPLLLDGKRSMDYEDTVNSLLSLVGLEERVDHRPDQLSGGEQQRVAIARALVTDPAIALADEPTGNLDRKSGREVLNLLRRACTEKGQTIVMVTHDPYAASFADRIVFLRDGQMVYEITNGGNGISPHVILDVLSELEN